MPTDFSDADLGNDGPEQSLREIVALLGGDYTDSDSLELALRKLRYLISVADAVIDGGNAQSPNP